MEDEGLKKEDRRWKVDHFPFVIFHLSYSIFHLSFSLKRLTICAAPPMTNESEKWKMTLLSTLHPPSSILNPHSPSSPLYGDCDRCI